jgi:hypothetical protein
MARPKKKSQKRPVRRKKALPVTRVKKAVSRAAGKVAARVRPARRRKEPVAAKPQPAPKKRLLLTPARAPKRRPDIPIEILQETYTPNQTSLKAPFRTTGEERQRDQEFASGYADERWNDEDHFTNKSGDPRIGTHGRSYEPGEK